MRSLPLGSVKVVFLLLLWNVVLLSKLLRCQFLDFGDDQVITLFHLDKTYNEDNDEDDAKGTTANEEPERAGVLDVFLLVHTALSVVSITLFLRHALQYNFRVAVSVLVADPEVCWVGIIVGNDEDEGLVRPSDCHSRRWCHDRLLKARALVRRCLN